jgi:hypothetical protein
MLNEVNPRHALRANRRAAVAAFSVVRFNHRAQFASRHDGVPRVEELVTPRALASRLEFRPSSAAIASVCCLIVFCQSRCTYAL